MRENYKMAIQYDGTRYNGWQGQGNTENTIQFKLKSVIGKVAGEDVEIIDSGRTDAGVRATGRVANVHMDTGKVPQEIKDYVNQYLPDDIAVTQLEETPDRFHSRLSVTGKVYIYWIETVPRCSIFQRKYIYILGRKLDMETMRQAVRLLCRTHDFKGFCSNKNMKRSTVRTTKTISIQERGDGLEIHVIGDGLLYNTVRILVGTLIEVGLGERAPDPMREILEAKDRQTTGATAPACRLFLTTVMYDS